METPKLTEISMIAINSVTGKEERVVVFKGVTYDDLDAWLAQEVKCPCVCHRIEKSNNDGSFECVHDIEQYHVASYIEGCVTCSGTGRLTLKALVEKLEVYNANL